MFKPILVLLLNITLWFYLLIQPVNSEIVKSIEISGNDRIASETIVMFSNIKLGSDLSQNDINEILKNLYETNFFEDITISLNNNKISISVIENPIIENITYSGIKSNTLKEFITENLKLIPRSSYNKIILEKDRNKILSSLKEMGYYFSSVNIDLEELDNNKVDLVFNITLGV